MIDDQCAPPRLAQPPAHIPRTETTQTWCNYSATRRANQRTTDGKPMELTARYGKQTPANGQDRQEKARESGRSGLLGHRGGTGHHGIKPSRKPSTRPPRLGSVSPSSSASDDRRDWRLGRGGRGGFPGKFPLPSCLPTLTTGPLPGKFPPPLMCANLNHRSIAR